MLLDVVLETLAIVTGIMGNFAMIPQIHRIFQRKSTKDISIWTYAYMLGAGVIWVLYGLNIQSFLLVSANLIGCFAMIGVIVGWVLYGR